MADDFVGENVSTGASVYPKFTAITGISALCAARISVLLSPTMTLTERQEK